MTYSIIKQITDVKANVTIISTDAPLEVQIVGMQQFVKNIKYIRPIDVVLKNFYWNKFRIKLN